jgi:threonyl-tRNA synthetase
VAVLTITNDADSYANEIHQRFIDAGVRSELDISSEKINYKVRNFSMQKIPLLAVVGKKEQENGTVAVRFFGSDEQKIMTVDELIEMVDAENKKYF